ETLANRGDRFPHALTYDLGIALVGVDHVDPAPVPELHVDLPRSILMVPGNDQPPTFTGQLTRQLGRPLLTDRLDHAVAEKTSGKRLRLLYDPVVVVHHEGVRGAHPARHLQGVPPPRDRDHPGSR